MKALWIKFNFFRLSIRAIKDPTKTDDLIRLSNRVAKAEVFTSIFAHISSDEDARNALATLPEIQWPDLQELKNLPPGTLGRAYAEHMLGHGLDPNFYLLIREHRLNPQIDYFRERTFRVHDLWHVLTGFTTAVEDEAGLQAFTLAQLRGPFSAYLLGLVTFHHALFKQSGILRLFERITWGFNEGKNCRQLFGVNWPALMHLPLEEVRQKFNITPMPWSVAQLGGPRPGGGGELAIAPGVVADIREADSR